MAWLLHKSEHALVLRLVCHVFVYFNPLRIAVVSRFFLPGSPSFVDA